MMPLNSPAELACTQRRGCRTCFSVFVSWTELTPPLVSVILGKKFKSGSGRLTQPAQCRRKESKLIIVFSIKATLGSQQVCGSPRCRSSRGLSVRHLHQVTEVCLALLVDHILALAKAGGFIQLHLLGFALWHHHPLPIHNMFLVLRGICKEQDKNNKKISSLLPASFLSVLPPSHFPSPHTLAPSIMSHYQWLMFVTEPDSNTVGQQFPQPTKSMPTINHIFTLVPFIIPTFPSAVIQVTQYI